LIAVYQAIVKTDYRSMRNILISEKFQYMRNGV